MQGLVMTDAGDLTGRGMVEGFARVVAVDAEVAWLEIESTAGCGTCAARAGCGVAGKFKGRSQQRFALANHFGAHVGDRVVVGIRESALLRASAVAYALPVATMVGGAVVADALGAGDGLAAIGAVGGLLAGLVFGRFRALRMAAAGTLAPVYVRHALDLPRGCAFGNR